MKLSILICGVPSRIINGKSSKILTCVCEQAKQFENEVEVLFLLDNKQRMLGEKRNDLVNLSKGKYIAFIDDDDEISSDYVKELIDSIDLGDYDVINFVVKVSLNDSPYKPCYYCKNIENDFNLANSYHRLPNHIMCVKRELAIRVPYKNILYGEDSDYSKRLKPLLKSQLSIDKVLYSYNYNSQTTETQFKK